MENIINDLQLRIVAMEKENKISNEENKISNDVLQNKINALQQENKKKDQEIKQKDEEIKLLQATLATYEWDAHRDLNYDSECDGNDRNGHTHGTLDNAADPNYNSSDNEDPRNDICYD
jgi:hypothetical protein